MAKKFLDILSPGTVVVLPGHPERLNRVSYMMGNRAGGLPASVRIYETLARKVLIAGHIRTPDMAATLMKRKKLISCLKRQIRYFSSLPA